MDFHFCHIRVVLCLFQMELKTDELVSVTAAAWAVSTLQPPVLVTLGTRVTCHVASLSAMYIEMENRYNGGD